MIRGEQLYDFDKNDFTADELEYIETRSLELSDEDADFVTGVSSIEYDDGHYVAINTQFPGVETFARAGQIHDEKAQDFEGSIELVSLRERVGRSLGGTSLYGIADKMPTEIIDRKTEREVSPEEVYKGHVDFMFYTDGSADSFSADELDYVWASIQKRIESLAPYTRLKVSQSEGHVSMTVGIESSLETHSDNLDRLHSLLVSSIGDTSLRIKVRHSYAGQGGASSQYRQDEFGYGVSSFDEYLESRKNAN